MPVGRGANFKEVPLNIAGSSVFGRYPKISQEHTFNMFISDNWLVPYAGYQIALSSSKFANGKVGRAVFTSTKFNRLVVVIDNSVYLVSLTFNQATAKVTYSQVIFIGNLETSTGVVYITESNKPQICISDGVAIYIYDPTLTPVFQLAVAAHPTVDTPGFPLGFVPGYLTFHDSYFLCAATQDFFYPGATNTWRLCLIGNDGETDGTQWPDDASHIGVIETKPDNTQAVVRFPSKGNMIMVMGSIVSETWFDTGSQLFPYQRNNQMNIDYGCLSPATVAYMDDKVVWLAQNEKSGPIIMYSEGGMPHKITTDGIDYLFSTLQNPQDSQAFLYRQDGHLFYHINFYSDNLSLYYDFSTEKFYNACDQNLNYFIAAEIAFFNNQYYFITRNNANLFAFDTIFTTYQDVDSLGDVIISEIPRIRTCANIRLPSQDYFIANDLGFTIESGETNYYQQDLGPIRLITQDKQHLATQNSETIFFVTQDDQFITSQNDDFFIAQQLNLLEESEELITQQEANTGFGLLSQPRVDLSISTDGGASFGQEWAYYLPPLGLRKNALRWWQIGIANDLVCQFKFWGIGRFVATDGVVNIR